MVKRYAELTISLFIHYDQQRGVHHNHILYPIAPPELHRLWQSQVIILNHANPCVVIYGKRI